MDDLKSEKQSKSEKHSNSESPSKIANHSKKFVDLPPFDETPCSFSEPPRTPDETAAKMFGLPLRKLKNNKGLKLLSSAEVSNSENFQTPKECHERAPEPMASSSNCLPMCSEKLNSTHAKFSEYSENFQTPTAYHERTPEDMTSNSNRLPLCREHSPYSSPRHLESVQYAAESPAFDRKYKLEIFKPILAEFVKIIVRRKLARVQSATKDRMDWLISIITAELVRRERGNPEFDWNLGRKSQKRVGKYARDFIARKLDDGIEKLWLKSPFADVGRPAMVGQQEGVGVLAMTAKQQYNGVPRMMGQHQYVYGPEMAGQQEACEKDEEGEDSGDGAETGEDESDLEDEELVVD